MEWPGAAATNSLERSRWAFCADEAVTLSSPSSSSPGEGCVCVILSAYQYMLAFGLAMGGAFLSIVTAATIDCHPHSLVLHKVPAPLVCYCKWPSTICSFSRLPPLRGLCRALTGEPPRDGWCAMIALASLPGS